MDRRKVLVNRRLAAALCAALALLPAQAGQAAARADRGTDLGVGDGLSIASDGQGDAVMAWRAPSPSHDWSVVKASYLRTGGRWSTARVISSLRGRSPSTVDATIDHAGTATVVWTTADGKALLLATWARERGWSKPRVLIRARYLAKPDVDAAGDGRVAVTWAQTRVDSDQVAHGVTVAMVRRAQGGWREPRVLSERDDDPHVAPVVALNPNGVATVVWAHHGDTDSVMTARWTPKTGRWSAQRSLFQTDLEIGSASLTAAGRSRLAAWDVSGPADDQGLSDTSVYAVSGHGRRWDGATVLDTARSRQSLSGDPRIGLADDLGVVSWLVQGPDSADLMASTRRTGGDWRAPAVVASAYRSEALDPDDTNDATLAVTGTGEGIRIWLGWVKVGTGNRERPMLSRWRNGSWTQPMPLGPRAERVIVPQAVASAQQRVVAAWNVFTAIGRPAHVVRRELR